MNIIKKIYWKMANPLRHAIANDESIIDLRERQVRIEDLLSGELRDRLVHIENWLSGELRERLVHIEEKQTPNETGVNGLKNKYATESYSQLGEDAVIMKLFQQVLHIAEPSFIDVGAHDPYEISNTALFHNAGCHGINIEANPILFKRFLAERPDDVNVNCGVSSFSDSGKEMPFYMIDDWSGRNSFSKEMVEKFVKDYPQFKIREVRKIPMKSLQSILDENKVSQCPDYMSIDIEGMEFDVLKDFDLKNNGPKVMTLEINEYSRYGEALKDLILDAGYFLWLKIGENSTFVKNTYKEQVYA